MQIGSLSIARRAWLALPLLALGCAGPQAETQAVESATAAPAAQVASSSEVAGEELPLMTVYLTPTCGCCGDWVTHVEQAGFRTEVHELPNIIPVKDQYGVPHHLGSCHTSIVGDYVIEGHVPADIVKRLLEEQPAVAGIAVPGMPMGSPGMEGPWSDPYEIIAFRRDGGQFVYDRR